MGIPYYMESNLFLLLADKYVAGTATEDERAVVEAYWELLSDGGEEALDQATLDRIQAEMRANVFAAIGNKKTAPVRRMRWVRYAAAAVLLFAIATTYILVNKKDTLPAVTGKADIQAPVTNRATIQLANGQTVYLDSASNGALASLGTVQLVKLGDGKIIYTGNTGEITYNTITNPRGSRVIDMELTDGSHVWLNAGSSMVYPVPMTGKTRDVIVKGEAYFEVAKDGSRPFTVSKGETKVTVYGTHFNVKAYDNDADIKITLLEGSVAVTQNEKRQLLKPGQQALVSTNNITLTEDADTEQAVAWKNGYTSFHSADIETVLKEIERWYDITTEIKGVAPSYTFYADVKRTATLADLLQILEDNKVKYEFDATKRRLTILP